MMQFMNLVTSWDWKSGSGITSRLATTFLLGMILQRFLERTHGRPRPLACGFLPLGSVFRSTLLAPLDAHRIQRAPNDVIAHARKILYATAADEHDRVFLKIVSHSRDVGRHLDPV